MPKIKKNKKTQTPWHAKRNIRVLLALLVAILGLSTATVFANRSSGHGFDALGYNRGARIFQGAADGTDNILDGTVWGDPTYANDKLKMRWNAEWDRGNHEGWRNPPYDAWLDNNWNGQVKGGSGEVWQYRIKWVGSCGKTGTTLSDGGYCIWGQFEVVLSQGTVDNQHFWEAHAIPSGFGD